MVGMDFDKNIRRSTTPFYTGWRAALASAIMVIVGLPGVRLRLTETPVFRAAVEAGRRSNPGHRPAPRGGF